MKTTPPPPPGVIQWHSIKTEVGLHLADWMIASKHETLSQSWRNVGLPSTRLVQHYAKIGLTYHVCWACLPRRSLCKCTLGRLCIVWDDTLAQHWANIGWTYRVCRVVWDSGPGSKHGIHPMLFQCWPSVFDAGPTLKQHWVNAPCLLAWLSPETPVLQRVM